MTWTDAELEIERAYRITERAGINYGTRELTEFEQIAVEMLVDKEMEKLKHEKSR